jgi:hypothetical protein
MFTRGTLLAPTWLLRYWVLSRGKGNSSGTKIY